MYGYLLYFLIFSFLGWCAEVVFYFFKTGRFVNRGLAKGPVCPIYGVGISLSYFLLGHIKRFIPLAILSSAVATAVELSVGILLDRALGVRLWDYRTERGNIPGYVCPRFSLIWGLVSALVIKFIPLIDPLIEYASEPRMCAIACSVFILMLVDVKQRVKSISLGDTGLKGIKQDK